MTHCFDMGAVACAAILLGFIAILIAIKPLPLTLSKGRGGHIPSRS